MSLFDEISPVNKGDFAYWISKPWLKDWRSAKPKMHTVSKPDPAPDDQEYAHYVTCEHGGLTPNIISRKRISPAVRFRFFQVCDRMMMLNCAGAGIRASKGRLP